MNRSQTGIEGLDKALNGGIPEKNIVLVSGGAGTGKSTLCLQYLINGASKFNEKGLYISTEQSDKELKKQAAGFGWDLEKLEKEGKIKLAYFDVTGGDSFMKRIQELFDEFKPQRIAVDSLTTLTDSLMISDMTDETSFSLVQVAESVSPIPRTEQVIAKTILYKLIKEIREFGVTTLMTSELFEGITRLSADGVSEFITDGVFLLYYWEIGEVEEHAMKIRKMRYTKHEKGVMRYSIENGITLKKENE